MRKVALVLLVLLVCWFASMVAHAADLKVPEKVQAGNELRLQVTGPGTLYVFGPSTATKREISRGEEVVVPGQELRTAGRYTVSFEGSQATFFAVAGPVDSLAFLARPSRVPAARYGVISGTAFLFDQYNNLVTQPTPVKFELGASGPDSERTETSKLGIAYVRMNSTKKGGPVQFVASSGEVSARRVVEQTASDPCTLHMKAEPSKDGILLSTDPIKDCSGNPVPDGTIVTFTQVSPNGKSSVDARIKRGIAQAELPADQNSTLSVASGVVIGNEIQWGGR